jgi:hypothetical protein
VRLPARSALVALVALPALVAPPPAAAELADETARAARFAPVLRLVEQVEECGHGEPYEPMDVDVLFGEPTVALRGPWNSLDLVKIGPAADDLVNRYEYHLDFPGDALNPGCGYERWARPLTAVSDPTVYAYVATEDGQPGKLALQYWFFYPFNDFNNLHEGDWEMIQLVFDARDPREAVAEEPESIGYSSHEGAERAGWDDDKLELVDGTHPVVFPAAAPTRTSSTRRSIWEARPRPASVATTPAGRTSSFARPSGRFRAIRSPRKPRSRGSHSRVGGASSRKPSSTAPPVPT